MIPVRYARWWGLAAGIAFGVADTATLAWLGVRLELAGRDVTWLGPLVFGSSSALLGWLLGASVDLRRRERQTAATIAAVRARLAASERLAALGQLAAAIAHEVRNPLAVVRSAAQGLAESRPGDPEVARASDFIVAETDRLTNVVASLLAFARPLAVAPQRVAVGELFDRALLLARDALDAKGIRVSRAPLDGTPAVQADRDLLCQVLLGLLTNAAAVVPAGGEIALAAHAEDGGVALAVADSGPGVPPDLRERVFEPFFTTRADGTGLGLAVARHIVEAHGGRIAVADGPAGGACFTVVLPAAA